MRALDHRPIEARPQREPMRAPGCPERSRRCARRWDNRLLLVAVVWLAGVVVLPAQITALATLDSTEFVIGDQWYLHLTANVAPGTEIGTVDLSSFEEAPNLEVIDEGPWQTLSDQGELIVQKDLLLTAWDSGYYFLPELTVGYVSEGQTRSVRTELLPVYVRTVPIPDTLNLAPLRPILREPARWTDYLHLIIPAGVLLLVALLVWFALLRKKPEVRVAPPPPPPPPAHVTALQRLAALRIDKSWQRDEIKAFVTELTGTVRDYLEGRYGIPAPERTTGQILRALQTENLTTIQRDHLREMLTVADLIKFAKARPEDDFYETQIDRAEAFVRQTKQEAPTADADVP